MSVRIKFDKEHCVGHALCAAAGPDVFQLDEDGYCIPPDENADVPPDLVDQAYAGADACPERVITVVDDGSSKATA